MNILPIVANRFYNIQQMGYQKKDNLNVFKTNPIRYDTVSFTSITAHGGAPLRKLAEYGMPDMYTGKYMMSYGNMSRMLNNGTFDLPLKKLIPILYKYNDTLLETGQQFLKILDSKAKEHPDIKITDALKQLFPEHQAKLLGIQKPILYEVILKASNMPKEKFDELMSLMVYTDQKIEKVKTESHFSEKEFIYRLTQIAKQIKVKKNFKETVAINKLIREAKTLFAPQIAEKKKLGRGIAAKKLKMEYQMQPEVFKQNTKNIQILQEMFEKSCLHRNKDIRNIFDVTNAKIYGTPIVEPFKRQEFIYDLKNIVQSLKDKELADEIIRTARQLPTSTENVSAFIVKHVNDSPEKIGYYLFKDSLASIEHLVPRVSQSKDEPFVEITVKKTEKKKKGKKNKKNEPGTIIIGKNHIYNYGMSSTYVNSQRSNMPFDEWIRLNPKAYAACQLYVDRLIKLYHEGKFKKVGLDKSYIMQFVERVRRMSPKEKPIILKTDNFV